MPLIFKTSHDLDIATRALIAREARFAPIFDQHGLPSLRRVPANLESLLLIVTEQFLSLRAAAAIWGRLKTRLDDFEANTVLACPQEELVGLGLSRAKARCFHACAVADIAFSQHDTLRPELLKIWGIGPWTAEIFMLSAMGDSDAWPVGDVALQTAAQMVFQLPQRPNQKHMAALADPWRPYRAAAARLLWAHYRLIQGLAQAPSQN